MGNISSNKYSVAEEASVPFVHLFLYLFIYFFNLGSNWVTKTDV